MKWIEAKVAFHHIDTDLAADLIADIFYEFDLQGVVIEDPDIEPDDGWAEDAVARPGGHAVIGYLPKDRRAEKKCKLLADKIGQLKNTLGFTYRISYKELDEEDWAEAWKAFFWPQRVGARIVVKPAFGTGTHPTTALCIEMIEIHLNPGDSFLDVGTGSGILMVVASKQGADKVYGVDKDEIAVDIATKNLMLNEIDPKKFSVSTGNLVQGLENTYDFIAANILTYIILNLLDEIKHVLKPQGIFVCSGILDENRDLVTDKMKEIGFEILEVASKEQWVAIAGRLRVQGSEG
jgi:ribosomal protein L11 methyltransferase